VGLFSLILHSMSVSECLDLSSFPYIHPIWYVRERGAQDECGFRGWQSGGGDEAFATISLPPMKETFRVRMTDWNPAAALRLSTDLAVLFPGHPVGSPVVSAPVRYSLYQRLRRQWPESSIGWYPPVIDPESVPMPTTTDPVTVPVELPLPGTPARVQLNELLRSYGATLEGAA